MLNDTVVSMLQGGFTTVERTLIEDGRPEDVERIRRSFQRAMQQRFTEVVEQATSRKVYVSQVHTDPDFAVELFMLEPPDKPIVGIHDEEMPE